MELKLWKCEQIYTRYQRLVNSCSADLMCTGLVLDKETADTIGQVELTELELRWKHVRV